MNRVDRLTLEISKAVSADKEQTLRISNILRANISDDYLMQSRRTDSIDQFGKPDERDAIVRGSKDLTSQLLHAAMGLVTEAGEFMGAMKAHLRYGRPLDRINLLEELGDLQWYTAKALRALESNFDQIQTMNINKLKTRFPDKFSNKKANEGRDVLLERQTMEMTLSNQPIASMEAVKKTE